MPGVEEDQSGSGGRLLLISNRLPITIKRSDDGQYTFSMSSGGLVTGLSGLSKTTSFQWYGWPGLEVPEAEAGPMRQRLRDEYGAVPVFVDDELADRHYNGFASKLFFPVPSLLRVFALTRTSNRLHPLAPFPLPPRRDHVR
jgi:trehalose 6-phosphate synthase